MSNVKKRYEGLDGIRALACIGIILSHIHLNANYNISDFWYVQMIPSFGLFVFLFMTISGFGMCCGYYERILKGQIDLGEFYKKRFHKIWPFFALVCTMDFLASPSKGAFIEFFSDLTMMFGFLPNVELHVIGVGWFLGVLFAFYFMFPFYVFVLSDKKRAWLSFVVALFINLCCIYYFNVNKKAIAYSFVYFMAGGLVYLYKQKLDEIRYGAFVLPLMIAVSALVYYFVSSGTVTMVLFNIFVLVYGMNVSEKHFLNSKPLRFLGNISFEAYLCHMMFYRIAEKIHLIRITSNEYANFAVVTLVVLVGTFVFAYVAKIIVNYIVEKLESNINT